MTAQELAQQLVVGLSVGATYALIALGYTMVYGVLRLINFAHGDVYMVGAVVGYYVANAMLKGGTGAWLTLAITFAAAVATCAVLGFLIEFLAYRPLRGRPRLVLLITAIGVSLLLENLFQIDSVFGPTPRSYPQPVISALQAPVGMGGRLYISRLDVLTLGLSLGLMIVLTWVVLKTKTGLALRAVSFRFDTAMLMGINTNRIISFTFMFGSGLAAVAGVLDGIRYNVQPLMGILPGLKAFIAAVLGGIGSIPGALIGGLLLGIIETFLRGVILPTSYSGYSHAGAFVILILILLLKPSGILGRAAPEKV